ncbi:hypothetical protein K438DRAFT_1118905 [Mycena galopus ATCC 62051]|nr:hypothetical protein K438DRAFT_1118905 [Mycena galopus ATCC 62051]
MMKYNTQATHSRLRSLLAFKIITRVLLLVYQIANACPSSTFGRFLPVYVLHSHVRRTGKCNLPFRLIEICSLSRAQPTRTLPSRFSPTQKEERHVNGTFLSSHPPSFIVALAKCSAVLAGGFDVTPISAECPNPYLCPQVSHECPDPASPFSSRIM